MNTAAHTGNPAADRVHGLDWRAIVEEVNDIGVARCGTILTREECASIVGLYDEKERFRSPVDMERFRFGAGEYRYFQRPLPDLVEELREAFYLHLVSIARDWARKLNRPAPWPGAWERLWRRAHRPMRP